MGIYFIGKTVKLLFVGHNTFLILVFFGNNTIMPEIRYTNYMVGGISP